MLYIGGGQIGPNSDINAEAADSSTIGSMHIFKTIYIVFTEEHIFESLN